MSLQPVVAARLVRDVGDLQAAAPDTGWPEVDEIVDEVLEALAHRLVDRASGAPAGVASGYQPPRPGARVRGSGGIPSEADHASCRAAAAVLRRCAPELGQPAEELADLLEQLAEVSRTRPLRLSDKSVVVRRLRAVQRSL